MAPMFRPSGYLMAGGPVRGVCSPGSAVAWVGSLRFWGLFFFFSLRFPREHNLMCQVFTVAPELSSGVSLVALGVSCLLVKNPKLLLDSRQLFQGKNSEPS